MRILQHVQIPFQKLAWRVDHHPVDVCDDNRDFDLPTLLPHTPQNSQWRTDSNHSKQLVAHFI